MTPAIVNIATQGTVQQENPLLNDPFFRRFFDVPNVPRERSFQSAGSGVIVDAKNGYIITNAHVIENADEITVTLLDNRSLKAKVIGKDTGSDVAVLQVKSTNLADVPIADSDRAEVGDFVVAIGNPFGLDTRSRRASSARSAARVSIRRATRISSRPMRRSIRATRAARSSI